MTFARPIDLRAGPTRNNYVFLAAVCMFAGLVALLAAMEWTVRLAGGGIAMSAFTTGWLQLRNQRGWQVIINNNGAISIGPHGGAKRPAALGQGSFRSSLFVTLPLRVAGGRRRYFLINRNNNDKDDYRRLLVWLNVGPGQK